MPAQMIRLVLVDGNPSGLRSAQVAGRTTIMTACPMATVSDLFGRQEARKAAVYLLIGPDPGGLDRLAVYIGECDSLVERFRGRHHALDRAEWSEILVTTTVDGVLNKAHALHVEDYLRHLVVSGGRARDMTRATMRPTLDEGDLAFVAAFAADAVVLAKVLGVDVFAPSLPRPAVGQNGLTEAPGPSPPFAEQPVFEYATKGVVGRMTLEGSQFVLKAGSTLVKAETPSIPPNVARVRADGLRSGQIVDISATELRVETDIPLGSVSATASVVAANSSTGTIVWRHVETGETYAAWMQRRNQVPDVSPDDGTTGSSDV